MTKAFEQSGQDTAALHAQRGALAHLVVIAWANVRDGMRMGEVNDIHAANPEASMIEYPEGDEYASLEQDRSRAHRLWA